jgi:hypothetical protein
MHYLQKIIINDKENIGDIGMSGHNKMGRKNSVQKNLKPDMKSDRKSLLNRIKKLQQIVDCNKKASMDTVEIKEKLIRLEILERENHNLRVLVMELKGKLGQCSSQSEYIKTLEKEKKDLSLKLDVFLKRENEIEFLRRENEKLRIQNKEPVSLVIKKEITTSSNWSA